MRGAKDRLLRKLEGDMVQKDRGSGRSGVVGKGGEAIETKVQGRRALRRSQCTFKG